MTSHIKLYGSKADRFETIKAEMTQGFGYEPSNPEVLGYLMANYGRGPNVEAAAGRAATAHGTRQN